MINTISKTLGAQEKTQDIKQSPSMKIGTKPYARSRRNELTEVTGCSTGRWRKVTGCLDQEARQQQASAAATGRWTGRWRQNRPNAELQHPIEYRKVPERRNYDRTRPVACDWTLAASDQLIAALTVGTTRRIRSGRDQRPVSSRKARFRPQWLLSQWGL